MKKTNSLVSILAAVSMPVIGLFSGGCETVDQSNNSFNSPHQNSNTEEVPKSTEYAAGGAISQYVSSMPNLPSSQARGFGIFSSLCNNLAQTEGAKEATAQIRPTQVNVNVNSNQQGNNSNTQDWKSKESFVCRGYKDLNGDGVSKDELIDVGNYFKCGREYTIENPLEIIIASYWENTKGQEVLTTIKKTRSGETEYLELVIPTDRSIKYDHMKFYKGASEGVDELKIEFYQNGRLDPSRSMSFFIDYGERENIKPVQEPNEPKTKSTQSYDDKVI
jgi:hypothetical protein